MDITTFAKGMSKIAPNYGIGYDNYGQVIIYTNLKETENNQYAEMSDNDFEENK
jgi:hypothetical protein